jgi:hypothetical protein
MVTVATGNNFPDCHCMSTYKDAAHTQRDIAVLWLLISAGITQYFGVE